MITGAPRREGVDEILYPGLRSQQLKAERRAAGSIAIPQSHFAAMVELARSVDLDLARWPTAKPEPTPTPTPKEVADDEHHDAVLRHPHHRTARPVDQPPRSFVGRRSAARRRGRGHRHAVVGGGRAAHVVVRGRRADRRPLRQAHRAAHRRELRRGAPRRLRPAREPARQRDRRRVGLGALPHRRAHALHAGPPRAARRRAVASTTTGSPSSAPRRPSGSRAWPCSTPTTSTKPWPSCDARTRSACRAGSSPPRPPPEQPLRLARLRAAVARRGRARHAAVVAPRRRTAPAPRASTATCRASARATSRCASTGSRCRWPT